MLGEINQELNDISLLFLTPNNEIGHQVTHLMLWLWICWPMLNTVGSNWLSLSCL